MEALRLASFAPRAKLRPAHPTLEYTDKLAFDRQRDIEHALRRRAVHKHTSAARSRRQRPLLVVMLMLLGMRGGMSAPALWSAVPAAALATESRHVPAVLRTPPHAVVSAPVPAVVDSVPAWAYESDTHVAGVYPVVPHHIPDAALGTEGATNTTGTLFVAP